jgi:hypothetical protein
MLPSLTMTFRKLSFLFFVSLSLSLYLSLDLQQHSPPYPTTTTTTTQQLRPTQKVDQQARANWIAIDRIRRSVRSCDFQKQLGQTDGGSEKALTETGREGL